MEVIPRFEDGKDDLNRKGEHTYCEVRLERMKMGHLEKGMRLEWCGQQ